MKYILFVLLEGGDLRVIRFMGSSDSEVVKNEMERFVNERYGNDVLSYAYEPDTEE